MSSTLTAAPQDSLLGAGQGPLNLRILGGERQGQVVQLRSPKVAIGSSPRCALRIRKHGIAPMHCLILRGAQQTLIRRLSDDTRLNDAAFDDAILRTGDRLGIGAIEFEVVDNQVHATEFEAVNLASPALNSSLPPDDPPVEAVSNNGNVPTSTATNDSNPRPANEQLIAECTVVKRHVRQRARKFVQELRLARNRNEELQRLETSRQQESRELDQRRLELETDIQTFFDQRDRWQEVRSQNERLVVWRREQLDEQLQQAVAERQAITGEREDLVQQQSFLAQQLADLERQRAALESERHSQREQEQLQRLAFEQRAKELDAQAKNLAEQQHHLAAAHTASDCLSSEFAELTALKHQLESERQAWESKYREWENQQAAATGECDRLGAQKQQLLDEKAAWEGERARESADLEQRQTELQLRQSEFSAQQAEFGEKQSALAEKESELKKLQAELAAIQADFQKRTSDIAAQQSQSAAEQNTLAEELQKLQSRRQALDAEEQTRHAAQAQREDQLRQATDALEQGKALLAEQQSKWETERSQQESLLTVRQSELDDRAAEIQREQQQFEQLRLELAEKPPIALAEPDRPEASPALSPATPREVQTAIAPAAETTKSSPDSAPATNDDEEVFARLRALSLLKTDEPEASDTPEPEPLASTSQVQESAADAAAPQPEESPENTGEESIDDYMSRLLQRMRGISGETSSKSSGAANSDRSSPAGAQAKSNSAPAKSVGESSIIAKKLLKLEPRKIAPEKSRDLAAMREIANLSARSAIATHHHRRGASRAWSNTFVGLVGLGCGGWLIYQSPETDSPFFYGGLLGIIVSLYWFAKARLLARSMRKLRRHQQQLEAISREKQVAESSLVDVPPAAPVEVSDAAKP